MSFGDFQARPRASPAAHTLHGWVYQVLPAQRAGSCLTLPQDVPPEGAEAKELSHLPATATEDLPAGLLESGLAPGRPQTTAGSERARCWQLPRGGESHSAWT